MAIKKATALAVAFKNVVPRGFEPRQTEPKPVVLPLHHRTILTVLSFEKLCKGKMYKPNLQIFCANLCSSNVEVAMKLFNILPKLLLY